MSKQQPIRNRTSNATASSSQPVPRPALDSLDYFVEGFVLKHRAQRHSPRTIEFYHENLRRLVWFLEHHAYPTTLPGITPNHIRHFFVYLQEQSEGRWGSSKYGANKPLAPSTIHAFARTLRAFFRWATKEARLQYNPFDNIDMPRVPSRWKVETYTEDEIGQLLAACNEFGTPFCVQRNRAILALLLDSGMRAGELLGLLVDDIDPRQGMFTVRGKGDKTRPVVVGSFARRELWAYLTLFRLKMDVEVTTDALFISHMGTPFTYDGLMRMFRKLKAKSGIDRVSVRPHMCRHTFATIAHRNGMRGATLQEALGHTTFDITRRYYLDVSKEDLVEEHARYGPLDHLKQEVKVASKARSPEKRLASKKTATGKIPDPRTLLEEVQHNGYRATGHKYGVSDNAIRGRLKRAGLL